MKCFFHEIFTWISFWQSETCQPYEKSLLNPFKYLLNGKAFSSVDKFVVVYSALKKVPLEEVRTLKKAIYPTNLTILLKSCKLIFDLLNIAPFFIFFRSLCTVVVQMDCRIVCLKPPFYYMQLFF